ncbi:hypothetical protein H9639_06435 [Arthrobacter sp. Sa2CUA1]|uniref:Uncharacterized protein n=1 Tax=Arthrobacter gallicola TaxID=2762225 RepID=A0ABR8UQW1_9MICC|nr:hypothetical protein [Arthrobacter gallicola]MBD7994933.1 hypothetical protein [Arthrobacter gallicola]
MSEYPNEEEQLKNPKPSGQSTGDDNWRGDAADQGNDIRFAEEQELIREQASPESVRRDDEGEYTDAEGSKEPPAGKDSTHGRHGTSGSKETEGGYTDSEGTQD